MNRGQKAFGQSVSNRMMRNVFTGLHILGTAFFLVSLFVFMSFIDSAGVCAAAAQSEASPISIITDKPAAGTPLSLSVNTVEEYTLEWYVDNKIVSTGESYTPDTPDYEKWIKVVLKSAYSGKTLGEDAIYFSKLPVVYINTDDGESITTKTDKKASINIQGNSQYTDQYSGAATIKLRGSSSTLFAQKPYKIKLDTSTNLFGMGKNKHWVLIANYLDQCGLRNMLGSSLSKQLGLVNMDMVYVDVVINGKYVGYYEMFEHIRIAEGRINIYNWEDEAEAIAKSIYKGNTDTLSKDDRDSLEDRLCEDLSWITSGQVTYQGVTYQISDYVEINDNISGGYIFELSLEYDEVSKFITSGGIRVMVNSPEYAVTCNGVMNYIKKYWRDFENAIRSKDGYNSSSVHYSEMADFDSMVSYWLTMEILGNDDAIYKSCYAYKDIDGLLTFGPAWDFDWGCASYTVSTEAAGWKLSTGTLWKDFVDDPYFQVKASEQYWANRDYLEHLTEDGGLIDETVEYLSEAGAIYDKIYTGKKWVGSERRTFQTDAAIFKDYLIKRIAWLDQIFATEDTTTIGMNLGSDSTNPYTKSSDKLAITFRDAVVDFISTHAPADGVICSGDAAEVHVSVLDPNTEKIAVYVNGLIQDTYNVIDSVCTFSVPEKSLTEEMGTKNVVSLIGYDDSGRVTYTNYASVIVSPDSLRPGTPYSIADELVTYDVRVPHIVINQAYGGSVDGYASHNFIELYNPGNFDIDLSSWSLQYRSGKDGDDKSTWRKLDLTGIIPAHSSYLIRCSAIEKPNKDAIVINEYDWEWDQAIHHKGISIVLIANQDLLDAETALYDNDKHIPLISDYVDLYSVSGDDTDTDDKPAKQETLYSEQAASAVQSEKKTIRRVNFADTDDNTVAGDFEVIDYSFHVDSYIDWISPRSSLDGAWDYKSNARPTYSVTYECGEGSSVVPPEEYGLYQTIMKPEDPMKEYYTFAGWYTDKELTNEYDFENQDPPAGNMTLYAGWVINTYCVTYESNGGSAVTDDIYPYGGDMTAPEEPAREGYTFTGWYEDRELTKGYTFEKMPAKNLTLYAGWNKNIYKVVYIDFEGTIVDVQEIPYGSSSVAPEAPKHDGYIFTGWTATADYVTEHMTIAATYKKIEDWDTGDNIPPEESAPPETDNNAQNPGTGKFSLHATYKKAVAGKKAKTVNSKNITSITLYTGKLKTAQLSVDGANHPVWWTSSKPAVAKVSAKGKVTAVRKGTVYITATVDGVSYQCKIIIKKAKITFARKTASVKMRVGAKRNVGANVVPKGIVTYKSSNRKVVTVSKSGRMKAKAAGKATITVKANGMGKKLRILVRKS